MQSKSDDGLRDISREAQNNVLLEYAALPVASAAYPNVYIIGYQQEGKDEFNEVLESAFEKFTGTKVTPDLVEESLGRSQISKDFYKAIKKIKKDMKTKSTSIAFAMVMNPNIHSKTSKEKNSVMQLMNLLGPEILDRCILVLIKGKEMLRGKKLTAHYNKVVNGKLCMCALYEKMYPRIIAIDIDDISNRSSDGRRQEHQMLSLLLAAGAGFDKPFLDIYMKSAFVLLGTAVSSVGWILLYIFYVKYLCHI